MINSVIHIQIQPQKMYILNLPSAVVPAIQAQTYYMAPDHDRDNAFITGSWDGKVQLLIWDGLQHVLPTGLFQRVVTVLTTMGYAFTVDNQIPAHAQNPKMPPMNSAMSVRPYQVSAAMAAMRAQPRLGGVLQMATGSGKTRAAAKLISIMKRNTLILVNQRDLLTQIVDTLTEMLGCPIGQIHGDKCDPEAITVATVQTIAAAAGGRQASKLEAVAKQAEILYYMRSVEFVVLDECHGSPANTAQQAISAAHNATAFMGLSASPWRDDGLDILIEAICGPVVYKINASELIDLGYLVQPEIRIENMPTPPAMQKVLGEKFHDMYKKWVVTDEFRNRYIAKLCAVHQQAGRVVIVLVKHVEHGARLSELIPNSQFMEGKLSVKKRQQILEAVKSGATRTLIATSLADQGLDLPIASALVLAGGGKSSTKALQRIGRVLRLYPGKEIAYVHDIVDKHSALVRHYRERMRIYATEPRFKIIQVQVQP